MLNIRTKDLLVNSENIKFILFNHANQGFLNKVKFHFSILLLFSLSLKLSSCSQEKHTFVSKNFHNTTAHYNAYFLAREKMKEVDAEIIKSNVDDYNKILLVYPEISPATVGSIKAPLEEVIKKASLINEKHKNSVWLDDGYIIIGKSYFYRHEFPTAMAFFKYVNSSSKDNIAKHAALVLLMRTYIDSADYFSAKTVSEYIVKKQKEGEVFSETNSKDYYLVKSYYHQKLDEFDKMTPNLGKAAPLLKGRDEKARINFILGQLYQMQGTDSSDQKAYKHYRNTIKRNPPYDLLFHAKLYSTQVSQLVKSGSAKKVNRYFKKLLRDKKNIDYKDKIYYEMARYELNRENWAKAIKNLEKSLRENGKNISQKGLSYLKIGEIYYDQEQFENSKFYYDSAVAVWNKEDKRFKAISQRQKVLAEFVGFQQIVQREDSLLALSRLSKEELDKKIDEVIASEKKNEALKKEKEEQKMKQETLKNEAAKQPGNSDIDGNSNSSFPLTNASSIASGKAEFRKVWGNRKLEDNWRRSQKDNFDFSDEKPKEKDLKTENKIDTSVIDTTQEQVVDKKQYYKDIPFTKDQQDTSNKRIEYAIYNIGKIYNQKLNESEKSIKSFTGLIKRFPNSEYEAEVYYFIYLIYKNLNNEKNSEVYKNKILSDFPNSVYARLLKNPNYLQDNKVSNQQAHLKYKDIFDLYKSGSYKAADSLIKMTRLEFPDNDIEDKLNLLSIMMVGQTNNAVVYKSKLEEFIENNPTSNLIPKAKELLASADSFISQKEKQGEGVGTTDVKYSTDLKKPHYFVGLFDSKVNYKKAISEFKKYNSSNGLGKMTVENMVFSDTTYLIVVKGFEEKFPSQVYINNLKDEKSFFSQNGYNKNPFFIITNHNFQLFNEFKNLDGYLKFYKENY